MRGPTYLLIAILCIQAATTSLAFTSTHLSPKPWLTRGLYHEASTLLHAETKKSVPKLEEGVKAKLLAESIAPWRLVRMFFYGSFGSGAFVGGFLTLAGLIAAKSGARSDVDIDEATINVAIDFGAASFFAVAAYLDSKRGAELSDAVEAKMERKKVRLGEYIWRICPDNQEKWFY